MYAEDAVFRTNHVKRRLKAGGHVLGCWTMLGAPAALQLLGHAGFDYLLIDHEHGIGEPSSLISQLQAVCNTPAHSIVLVPCNDQVTLKRVLDAGAEGVMIPSIESAEEARAAVAACRYPPNGRRGTAASSVRASNWGMAPRYVETCADELLICLQIESVKGAEAIDEIAAVDGVDVVLLAHDHLGQFVDVDLAGCGSRRPAGNRGQHTERECC